MTLDQIKALTEQAGGRKIPGTSLMHGGLVVFAPDALAEFVRLVREQALEEAAAFIERGSFLHDQSPAKLFANQLVPKIRSLK